MKNKLGHPGRNGFTLIELLVVIAIISLLVSILIPSLTKAKALTRNVVCQSNLKGIGLALGLYAADYDGMIFNVVSSCPIPPGENWGYYVRWDDRLRFYYMEGPRGDGYYPAGEVTTCPEEDADMNSLGHNPPGAGYGMNDMVGPAQVIRAWNGPAADALMWKTIDSICPPPSSAIWVTDSSTLLSPGVGWNLDRVWPGEPWEYPDSSWLSAPARRHIGTSFNELFFDFHVENAKWPEQITDSQHRWNLWDYQTWNAFYNK